MLELEKWTFLSIDLRNQLLHVMSVSLFNHTHNEIHVQ